MLGGYLRWIGSTYTYSSNNDCVLGVFFILIVTGFLFCLYKLLDEPTVCTIAAQYNKTTAQVLLKWALQHDVGE